ncbi:ABC transporter ATP-binding protein [Phnomibacter sp. MR]|uniref:ABC transporter ATP-binding protein n=1 Tax=Phnomibacter sp. MR TaxID=3042318 RepID=UPI003A7FBC3B
MSGNKSTSRSFDMALFGRVMRFVQPYRRRFYLSLVLALVLAVLSPVRGLFIQYTVDKGLKGQTGNIPAWLNDWFDAISHGDMMRFILLISILQVAMLLVETAIRFVFTFSTAWLGQHVVKDLRVTVYNKVLRLNLRQFDKTPIGTLTTRTINDIESINEIFADGLIPIIADFLTIVFTLATMFWMDWQLTLIGLIPFPLLLLATWRFKNSVNKSFIKVRNAVASLNAFVQEHINGMQLVQAFAAEDREMGKFRKINKEHRNANINAIFAYSVFFPVVEVVLAVSLGLLVWWVADQRIEAGKLVAFILFMNQIFRPLRVIADKFNVIQMGMVASERVFKVLDNNDQLPEPTAHALQPAKVEGSIAFEKVNFAYEAENWVLKNVDFRIAPGQTVAIVGSTGSGKTTIISLLNRLYEVEHGRITIDGHDIRDYHPDALRSRIGVVLQDVFLFAGSVHDNLTLRNPDIPRSRVEEVCRLIGIDSLIQQLPGGYDFNVLERGATMSAGQRQLLSFARCLLYNPAILILDEATSNIDSESEQLIQQAIDKMIQGRTSIVIAHRLSTIRKANIIMVMERGELKEMGSHEALLAKGGLYARLHSMQFEEENVSLNHIPG